MICPNPECGMYVHFDECESNDGCCPWCGEEMGASYIKYLNLEQRTEMDREFNEGMDCLKTIMADSAA